MSDPTVRPSTVALLGPLVGVDHVALSRALSAEGFMVKLLDSHSPKDLGVDCLIVSGVEGLESVQFFDSEMLVHRPILVLVDGDEDHLHALALLKRGDAVARLNSSPQILAGQLAYLLRQGREVQRLYDFQFKDALTGLMNPRGLAARANELLEHLDPAHHWGLFVFDLDNFKAINDEFGHAFGDDVLRAVARGLREHMQVGELLCRLGGEEFAVLIQRDSQAALVAAGEDLRVAISTLDHPLPGKTGAIRQIRASGGMTFLQRGIALDDVLHQADQALYEAKAKGRDRLICFEEVALQALEEDSDVQLIHFQNVSKIVTERTSNLVMLFGRSLVQRFRQDAMRDELLGIWNKRYFDHRLPRDIARAQQDGQPLALALLDLDFFGQFNKDYGLRTGDGVLQTLGQVVNANIRSADWFARYGGEEFALVVPGKLEEAWLVAERIRAMLEVTSLETHTQDDRRVTVSIGVAELGSEIMTAEQLIDAASTELRRAKRAGRNRVYPEISST